MSGSILDKLAKLPAITRKSWNIEDEPKHLNKDEYFRTTDIHTGEPVWEETDESMRSRLKSIIDNHGKED